MQRGHNFCAAFIKVLANRRASEFLFDDGNRTRNLHYGWHNSLSKDELKAAFEPLVSKCSRLNSSIDTNRSDAFCWSSAAHCVQIFTAT